jgi:hypothetical protein
MMPRNLRLTLVSCGMPFGSTLLARRLAGADQGRDRPQPPRTRRRARSDPVRRGVGMGPTVGVIARPRWPRGHAKVQRMPAFDTTNLRHV